MRCLKYASIMLLHKKKNGPLKKYAIWKNANSILEKKNKQKNANHTKKTTDYKMRIFKKKKKKIELRTAYWLPFIILIYL